MVNVVEPTHTPHSLVPINHTVELETYVALAPDLRQRVAALIRLSLWYIETDRGRATATAAQALAQAQVLGDHVLLGKARYAKAVAEMLAREDPTRTEDHYYELTRIGVNFAAQARPIEAAWCDLMAGVALERLGDSSGTILLIDRALTVFRRFGDLGGQARCLNTFGVQQSLSAHHHDALRLYQRAAELAVAADRPGSHVLAWMNAAEARINIALQAFNEGKNEPAINILEIVHDELVVLRRRLIDLGHRHLQARLAGLNSLVLAYLGREKAAIAEAEAGIVLALATGLQQSLGSARCYAGQTHLAVGDHRIAHNIFRSALEECGAWIRPTDAALVLRGLVETSESAGDLRAALDYHKRLLDVELIIREQTAKREREVARARLQLAEGNSMDPRAQAAELIRVNQALLAERDELQRLAHTDAVTGLANRRRFDAQMQRMSIRAELTGRPLSLIIVDIDRFKVINDKFSHLVGDEVLRRVAATLQRSCRRGDMAARVGGEEFALLLPGMALQAAIGAAERLRRAVRECDVSDLGPDMIVTVSVGVAAFGPGSVPEQVYGAADDALYQAKESGRDRVCVAPASLGSAPRLIA
ncbi:MAG: diguanylate cyclase [Corynebacteriales bacterium]|nr:diguanylate cyclase [Mycobacteriales bacterium]